MRKDEKMRKSLYNKEKKRRMLETGRYRSGLVDV